MNAYIVESNKKIEPFAITPRIAALATGGWVIYGKKWLRNTLCV